MMIDFEQSIMLDRVCPSVPQKGCLFHLSKNIYKHVQNEGLTQLYLNDAVFRTNIRMISAISFAPIADTIKALDELCNHVGNQEQVILDYFESTYIDEMRRGRRLPPRFPHAMWNMNMRIQQDLPRTNNDLEGWHNRFSGSLRELHSHIWKFVEGLQAYSSLNHHRMTQLLAGAPNPPQRRVYHGITERILLLVHGYNNNNIIDFLGGVSYNLA